MARPSIKTIFHTVVEAAPTERESVLTALTRGDRHLRAEVESLLDADRHASGVDSMAKSIASLIDPMLGRSVGPYRIEREIGHGGMGTVYLARRLGEFDQQVALKIVRRGMDTALVLERFVAERQILADLEHPNIARLLDGGSTDDGRPYFVMEYLDATPITTYCEQHQLPVEARIRLFLIACAAVQHAHQRLVVHRDLKPGNVVVTVDGTPKLLDFGLAKLLDRDAKADPLTLISQRMMTPHYASPEQIRGRDIGIPSDVYSLGVLLYELLTGVRPDSLQPPSAVAPGPLRRRLRGDIDTIVMTALRTEPQRRYQAVHELSADLWRHLESRPIAARRDSTLYRARKFATRHLAALIAGLLVVLSMSSAIALTARSAKVADEERDRAERRLDDVRQLTHQLLFDLHDEIGKLPGNVAVRQHLLARAVEHLDELSADTSADRELQLEMASAYDRAGALAFDMSAALASYRKAATLFERLTAEEPANVPASLARVQNLNNIGDLQKMRGDVDAAIDAGQRAFAIADRLGTASAAPAASAERHEIETERYRSLSIIGLTEEDAGRYGKAIGSYGRALEIARTMTEARPDLLAWRRRINVASVHIAINHIGRGQPLSAMPWLAQAESALLPLLRAEPVNVNFQRDFWNLRLAQGRAHLLLGDAERAHQLIAEALLVKQRLADSDPGDTGHQRGLAVTHFALSEALRALPRGGVAITHASRAIAISSQLVSKDAANLESRIDLGEFELGLARLQAAAGRRAQALTTWRSATALLRQSAERSPGNQRLAEMIATAERRGL